MSVIVLSSEDEDDCFIIEKEEGETPAALHQVFVPECNPDDFERVPEQADVDDIEAFSDQIANTIIYYGPDDKVDFDPFESELAHGNAEGSSTKRLQGNNDCSSKETHCHEKCPDALTQIDVNVVICNNVSSCDRVKEVGEDAKRKKLKFIAETLSALLRDTENATASKHKTLKNSSNVSLTEKSIPLPNSEIGNQNRKHKNSGWKSGSRLEKVSSKKACDKNVTSNKTKKLGMKQPLTDHKQPPNVERNSFTKYDIGGSDGVNQNNESENNQDTRNEPCQSRLTNIKKQSIANDTETDSKKKILGRKRVRPKTTKIKPIHTENGVVANVPNNGRPQKKQNMKSSVNKTTSESDSCKAIAAKAISYNVLDRYFINSDMTDYIQSIVKSTLNEMLGNNTNLGKQRECIEKVCLDKVTQSVGNNIEVSVDKEINNKTVDTPIMRNTSSIVQSKSDLNEGCQEVSDKSTEVGNKEIFLSVEKERTVDLAENNIADGIQECYPNTLSNTDCYHKDKMKKDFVKLYHIVFNDEVEYLCMTMGDLLLLAMTESSNCKDRLMKANKFTCDRLKEEEVSIAMTCYRKSLIQYRDGFADPFNKFLRVLRGETESSPVQHRALLIAWFLKLFLRVSSLSPEFFDYLHDAKLNVISLLSVEALKAHFVGSVFVRNETEFESDCWLVLDFMQGCFEPDSGQNSDKSISHKNKDTVPADKINLNSGNLEKPVSPSNQLIEHSSAESPNKTSTNNVTTAIHTNNPVNSGLNRSQYQSVIHDSSTKNNLEEANTLPQPDASTLDIFGDTSSILSPHKTSVDNTQRDSVLPPSDPVQSGFNGPEYYSTIQNPSTNKFPDKNFCARLEDRYIPQTHPVQSSNATGISTSSYSPTKIPQQSVIVDPSNSYAMSYPSNRSTVNERLTVQEENARFSAYAGRKRHPGFENNIRKTQRTEHATMHYNQGQQNQQSSVFQMSGYPHTGNGMSTKQRMGDSCTLSEKRAVVGTSTQPCQYEDMLYYQAKQSILRHMLNSGSEEVAHSISNPQNPNQYPFVPNRIQQRNPPRYPTLVNTNRGSYMGPNMAPRGDPPPYPGTRQDRFVPPERWPYYQQRYRNVNPAVYNAPNPQPPRILEQNVNSNSLTGPLLHARRENILKKRAPGAFPFATSHSAPSALKEHCSEQRPKLPKYNIDGRLNSVETPPEFEVPLKSSKDITRSATINNHNAFMPSRYTHQFNYNLMVEKYGPLNRIKK
ncbi:uncharacterized protein LOC124367965 [Homalodisca vitripennis]|uniref:uncharacterized protein LOC124367965 n=1 Tax=Homalodisca vitripennis TaxID=197043 RepID=UPI001EECC4D6|nr:uncharacterized protein LOC124367965 [Homalodisca vitripennis]